MATGNNMRILDLIEFLNKLEKSHIYYKLDKIRKESILVEVAVPGQRWEIEFMDNGTIEIEKFIADGCYYHEEELQVLFREFSD